MFTGIIEDQGLISERAGTAKGLRLSIRFNRLNPKLKTGDSVAVNGVCLTAAKITPRGFEADVIEETIKATTLGFLEAGAAVNLERAVRFGGRMGGHAVSGHVDGCGAVVRRIIQRGQRILWIRLPARIRRFCLPKGSVTIDGVSLTIQDAKQGRIKIALIPYTLKITTLGCLREGSLVNIEADRSAGSVQPQISRENAKTLKRKIVMMKRQGF